MAERFTIASLNRVLTIRHIAIAKNDKGLPIKLITSQQTTYAQFRQASNSYGLQQQQTAFGEQWEAIMRWEPNRIILPNDQLLYQGVLYTINGIERKEEGNLQWVVIRCSFNNQSGATSGGEAMKAQKELHVKGNVTIGGADYSNWTGTILAYRDGIQFTVKRDGSAANKEINYDINTGLFTYPADLFEPQPNEPTDIYFL